jgi:hypothetical protein
MPWSGNISLTFFLSYALYLSIYNDPVKLTNLSLSTTFINDVDLPTLGLLVPILTRGMRERMVNVKRRAALVIGNMCKLVNDPRTAAQVRM